MRVDFYQLSRDPAEAVIPLLTERTLAAGERLLVVSADDAQLAKVDQALWLAKAESFLAHGFAGGQHDARQPVLLSDSTAPANQARFAAFADGQWREEFDRFERVFLLFDKATIDDARSVWRSLDAREDVTRNYWEQDGGKWVQRA